MLMDTLETSLGLRVPESTDQLHASRSSGSRKPDLLIRLSIGRRDLFDNL
jgi:hypothetical protein